MVGLAVARRREIAVRLSLGAPRTRLIRQLLTESVLLALIAAAVGLVVTTVGIRLIGTVLADMQLVVDWHVTIATCAVAIVVGLLFGLSPALHATRISVGEVLKSASSSVAATRSRLQRILVVAQIALTQPLLVGLGVVIMTMVTDMGTRATSQIPANIAEIELDTWAGRVSVAERTSRIAAVVARVAAMPGVVAAMPMQMGTMTVPLTVYPADRIAGVTYAPVMTTSLTAAPRGYFKAFEIPIVRGRDFDASDYANASNDALQPASYDAVIIGTDLARRLWGDANPVGRHLAMALTQSSNSSGMVVVGVVNEATADASDANGRVRVYIPYSPINTGVIARTAGPALPMLNALRQAVAAEAPQMPISRVETMEQREANFRRDVLRTSSAVAGGGLLALLLSRDRPLRGRIVRGRSTRARNRDSHGTRRAARRGRPIVLCEGSRLERVWPHPGIAIEYDRDSADCENTQLAAGEPADARCCDRRGGAHCCVGRGVDSGAPGEHDRSADRAADGVIARRYREVGQNPKHCLTLRRGVS